MHPFKTSYKGDNTAEDTGLDKTEKDITDFRKELDGMHVRVIRKSRTENGYTIAAARTDEIPEKGQ